MGNQLEGNKEPHDDGGAGDAADFGRIRAAGFDTVRIPVKWSNKTGAGPDYTIAAGWLDRVSRTIDEALAAGLNVIVDDHNFPELDRAPEANSEKLAAIWRQVAARLADRPVTRLWFEIENEPHGALVNAKLGATLGPALAAIRASNPTRPVIIGGGGWSSVASLATLELPDDPQVYPTFHYYEPLDFTHQGATWAKKPFPVGREYGTAADKRRLQADVAAVAGYIKRTGRVPLLGETGAYDRSTPLAQRAKYTRAVYRAFRPLGVGVCEWAYSSTFPFYDRGRGRWLPGMRGAMGLPEK